MRDITQYLCFKLEANLQEDDVVMEHCEEVDPRYKGLVIVPSDKQDLRSLCAFIRDAFTGGSDIAENIENFDGITDREFILENVELSSYTARIMDKWISAGETEQSVLARVGFSLEVEEVDEDIELKRLEEERLELDRLEEERIKREEEEETERLRLEEEERLRLEEEEETERQRLRLEQEEETKRLEQERLEEEKLEQERLEERRIVKEQERLEEERLEQERLDEERRIAKEEEESWNKRLEEDRLIRQEQERKETERLRLEEEETERLRLEEELYEKEEVEKLYTKEEVEDLIRKVVSNAPSMPIGKQSSPVNNVITELLGSMSSVEGTSIGNNVKSYDYSSMAKEIPALANAKKIAFVVEMNEGNASPELEPSVITQEELAIAKELVEEVSPITIKNAVLELLDKPDSDYERKACEVLLNSIMFRIDRKFTERGVEL